MRSRRNSGSSAPTNDQIVDHPNSLLHMHLPGEQEGWKTEGFHVQKKRQHKQSRGGSTGTEKKLESFNEKADRRESA